MATKLTARVGCAEERSASFVCVMRFFLSSAHSTYYLNLMAVTETVGTRGLAITQRYESFKHLHHIILSLIHPTLCGYAVSYNC